MGKVIVTLSDEVEREFREVVEKKFGRKRGALSIAFEGAIRDWLARMREELSRS